MHDRLLGNLDRQSRGFSLLCSLLDEEFHLLLDRNPQAVTGMQLTIHELVRQLVVEREEVRKILQGKRLMDYIAVLEGVHLTETLAEELAGLKALYRAVDGGEQQAAHKAERNAQLVLGLLDQSQSLLTFLHEKVAPKDNETVYSKRGAYPKNTRPEAQLIKGRL